MKVNEEVIADDAVDITVDKTGRLVNQVVLNNIKEFIIMISLL